MGLISVKTLRYSLNFVPTTPLKTEGATIGQKEVLEAVVRLNDRLDRPVSKKEIAAETGISFASTGRVLAKLKRWGDIELKNNIIKKGVEFRYSVPKSVREKIGV